MKIFVSYANKDVDKTNLRDFVESLNKEDYVEKVYFWERDCEGGQNIMDYMIEGIKASDAVLVFDSKTSAGSIPVQQEIAIALSHEKKIVPVFTESAKNIEYIKDLRGCFLKTPVNKDAILDLLDKACFLLTDKVRKRELDAKDALELIAQANTEMEARIPNISLVFKVCTSPASWSKRPARTTASSASPGMLMSAG